MGKSRKPETQQLESKKRQHNQIMQSLIRSLTICAVVSAVMNLNAQNVTVNPAQLTLGYMNWSPAPGDATGYGGYGSSSWGLSALQANFSGNTLTLNPNVNTYTPGNNYWNNADGSGANIMDANIYNETSGQYVNTTLTFTFDVLANTLTGPYSSEAFIKDFAPDYSSFTQSVVPLTAGVESVSLLTSANPADHVQYGFETDGPDTNPASPAAGEFVTIIPVVVPEPSSLAVIGFGLLGLWRCRSRRSS
jgi:hypothetical protein